MATTMTDDEHRALAREMLARQEAGESKSSLELEYWGTAGGHGQRFSNYVRKWLDIETVHKSPQSQRLSKAEELLRVHGIVIDEDDDLPEPFRLLSKSREAALAALRVYNDPVAGFRTETFSVLMIIAWNTLCQAILERDQIDYIARDEHGQPAQIDGRDRYLETRELLALALRGPANEAKRANIDFFIGLRNQIAHRYLPVLDPLIVPEAQALLLNFEQVIVAEFGTAAQLGDRLAVPLQLSGFRNGAATKSLKELEQRLPVDVLDYLTRHRQEQPEDVARSPEYSIRVFLVPVAANRFNQADAIVNFVRPEDVSDEMIETLVNMAVLPKQKIVNVGLDGCLLPKAVVERVRARIPYEFTVNRHTYAWRYYKVRPPAGSADPKLTDSAYCVYDTLSKNYGYTQAWVDKLAADLSDPAVYETVLGIDPTS